MTTTAETRSRTGMIRVGAGLLVGTVTWSLPFSAAMSALLPQRIAQAAPDDKVALLAVLTGIVAVVGLISNMVFGALSDLTRSRWGARTPWIVGGAVGAGAFMVVLADASSFGEIVLWWSLAIFCLNATVSSVAAILPDRVPVTRRATLSATQGVGILLGTAIGTVVGAVFLQRPETGLRFAAVAVVVLAVTTVLLAPDHPSEPSGPRSPADHKSSFTLPRQAPDFYWALWGRLFLVVGYFMINGFQLYILTDHVGLSTERAAEALGVNSIVFLVAALIAASIAGPLSDRSGRRKVFVIGVSGVIVVAVLIPMLWATAAGMTGFAVVGGLAFGAYYSVDAALISEVLPSRHSRARDLGILNAANTTGQVLAPAASSALVGLGIGYTPVFLGAMTVCVLGAFFIKPIRSVR
ncbi:MFS transporter [Lentzea sp. NPDC092896]|uniref:MFS transporter n=1 Tax=Lentzea sp. NPDC092896 TaxID=3364127 RepID=UPI00381104B1